MSRRINFAFLTAVFEAGVLISATLFLCGLYLQYGGKLDVRWGLALLVVGFGLSLWGMGWAAYRSSLTLETESRRTRFRINDQLVRTLEENAPRDVAAGLKELLDREGYQNYTGRDEFGAVLERQFGPARANEIRDTVFKYARFTAKE